MRRPSFSLPTLLVLAGCNGGQLAPNDAGPTDAKLDRTRAHDVVADAGVDVAPVDVAVDRPPPPPPHDGPYTLFSELPGSVCFGKAGKQTVVPGGRAAPSLTWLTLPDGFCAHYFANVSTARQLRVAPGGEVFVASPSTGTAGGAPPGLGAVVVLADDDGDGYADGDALPYADGGSPTKVPTFVSVASVQGLAFAPGAFYYQDDTRIMKVAYASGQRTLKGTPTKVVDVTIYRSAIHWPKTLDIADDGTIYLANGGDQGEICNAAVFPRPFHGGILSIDGTPGGTPVAQGFRNPIAVRCQRGHNLCFASELALDGSGASGGREKVVPIRKGDDWGFPCCATTNAPYAFVSGTPNCSGVAQESVALEIGDTPFGLDFEPGLWPAPYTKNMIVTLHGAVASLAGERVLAVPVGSDGMLVTSSDIGSSTVPDFATGWDHTSGAHGRPAAVTFGADGRAYIANDFNGDVFWIAPVGLKIH